MAIEMNVQVLHEGLSQRVRVMYQGSMTEHYGDLGVAEIDDSSPGRLRVELDCGEALRNVRPTSVLGLAEVTLDDISRVAAEAFLLGRDSAEGVR